MSINPRYSVSQERMKDELAIIELAKEHPSHFGPLYSRYHERIYRFVLQRVNDEFLADDITSQVFVKAMQKLNTYRDMGFPFSSWLYRIAYSEVVQFFRDNSSKRFINVELVKTLEVLEEADLSEIELQKNRLAKAIKLLNEKDLNYIELRFFEERSFKEISEILDMEENAVKVATFRALEKLRNMFHKKTTL